MHQRHPIKKRRAVDPQAKKKRPTPEGFSSVLTTHIRMKNMNTDESMYAAIGKALVELMGLRVNVSFENKQDVGAAQAASENAAVVDPKREVS